MYFNRIYKRKLIITEVLVNCIGSRYLRVKKILYCSECSWYFYVNDKTLLALFLIFNVNNYK